LPTSNLGTTSATTNGNLIVPKPKSLMRQKTKEIYPGSKDDKGNTGPHAIVPLSVSPLTPIVNPLTTISNSPTKTLKDGMFNIPTNEQTPNTKSDNNNNNTENNIKIPITPKMILASPKSDQQRLEEELAINMLIEQKDTREILMSHEIMEKWGKPFVLGLNNEETDAERMEEANSIKSDVMLDLYNAMVLQRYSEGEYINRKEQWLRGLHVLTRGNALITKVDPKAEPTQQVNSFVEPYEVINTHVLRSLSGHCISRGEMIAGKNGCSTMYVDGMVAQKILQRGAFRVNHDDISDEEMLRC
jgi:hypothetical protein